MIGHIIVYNTSRQEIYQEKMTDKVGRVEAENSRKQWLWKKKGKGGMSCIFIAVT